MQGIDWAAIEAVAAVAGVIGVVISIIFLIYEVRHNARAIEGATVQSLMSLEREVFTSLAENADLMTKGGWQSDTLTDAETYRYERAVGCYMSLVYSGYVQHERELIQDEVWEAYLNPLDRHLAAPGFARAWQEISVGYPQSFQDKIATRFKL